MLTVLDPGLFTTAQDWGRWGYQGYGVPVSGAMDLFALCVANALVGNAVDDAVIEIHSSVTLQSDDPHLLVLTGAQGSFQIDGRWMPQWTSVFARGGSLVEIAPANRKSSHGGNLETFEREHARDDLRPGGWLYLAIHGGIDVPRVLGSRSTFVRGSFGGLAGRAIEAGDVIPVGAPTMSDLVGAAGKSIDDRARSFAQRDSLVRVVIGPHDNRFTADAIEHLTKTEYAVTTQADRMGYRLSGLPLARRDVAHRHLGGFDWTRAPRMPMTMRERSLDLATSARELVSCGVPLGAIQVPPDGLPIVLMADHQTTGGYPIIATVIAADVALIAQRAEGDAVRFRTVDVEEAQRAWIEMWQIIEKR